MKTSLELQIMNTAGDALFTIMANQELAANLPKDIKAKINKWYKLTLKSLGKDFTHKYLKSKDPEWCRKHGFKL